MSQLIIDDLTGTQWYISVNNNGEIFEDAVVAPGAPAFVYINDTANAASYQLSVVGSPPPLGYSHGDLLLTSVTFNPAYPIFYHVESPTGLEWLIAVQPITGYLETFPGDNSMSSPALPLTPVVNVVVIAGPSLGVPPTYNQGCIIGSSAVIPTFGGSGVTRIRQYNSLNGMLADGFTNTEPEYLAAQLYFGQTPAPEFLWVGRQDLTAIATLIPHSGNAGTGYKVGDIIAVTQGGATGGWASVTTIGGSGAVTGLAVVTTNDGTGYTVATALATTNINSTGSGLEVDITAVGETPLIAFQNCRIANSTWYAGVVVTAVTADHEAIAAYAQAATPLTFYWATTGDAAVLNNTTNNLAAFLKAASYTSTALIYSTTQSGAAPNNAYAAAAAMGLEMGLNTGLANSYFTMWGKVLTGVIAEPLTQSQVNVINGNNCNVYIGYVNQYTILQPGITPGGIYVDQILNRAILQANLQFAIMNLLVSVPSVPQTDPGEQQLIHVCNAVCQEAVTTGYLAPGTYEGIQPIIDLDPGDPLPGGFLCQAFPFATQSQADHAARKAMPIYIVINESGAVQSVVINVIVNL